MQRMPWERDGIELRDNFGPQQIEDYKVGWSYEGWVFWANALVLRSADRALDNDTRECALRCARHIARTMKRKDLDDKVTKFEGHLEVEIKEKIWLGMTGLPWNPVVSSSYK
jgi:hypothetical protein